MKNQKLLFTELRVLVAEGVAKTSQITPEGLKSAFIDQENLKALGYDLKNEGLMTLALEYSAGKVEIPLFKRVQGFEPEIKVSPMYPNFPQQVLEMSEFEYRKNQFIHYFSTYGLEFFTGMEVSKGWLPKTEEIQERAEDVQVIKLKTLDYLTESEVKTAVAKRLIGKKERLLPNELEIAKEIALQDSPPVIEDIPFKENIYAIYGEAILGADADTLKVIINSIRPVFKHPGDVLELVEFLVKRNKFMHLRTSLKRALVDLIESFPLAAIEENLASHRWSKSILGKGGKKRSKNRNVLLIDYLSFSRFSKKPAVMNLVNELKDGNLISWNQKLELAYTNEELDKVRELLLQRPGVYFRQVNRLYKAGVPSDVLSADVIKFAANLKTQSIVSTLNNYNKEAEVTKVFYEALIHNLKSKSVEQLKGKKVFIDESEFDFTSSKLSITDKSAEGGYIQNGLAIKIPDDVKILRFFTYWNDERRIDIDLHARFAHKDGSMGHVGFHSDFRNSGVVHSGDITHSNAAEYIDMDLDEALYSGVKRLQFNINSFTGVPFNEIKTVFTGMMAVSSLKQAVKLYNGKNVFFRHDLNGAYRSLNYAFIDVEKRLLYILGDGSLERNDFNLAEEIDIKLSVMAYLKILLSTQGSEIVSNKEDAEVILGLTKSDEENYYSLIDENYFMEV